MKIKFTGMVNSNVPKFYLSVFETLSVVLSDALKHQSYGVLDEVVFMIVAIDDTLPESESRSASITEFTRYTHPFTKRRFRALFIAIPFAQQHFSSMDGHSIFDVLCDSVIRIVLGSPVKVPKDVDFMRLKMDLIEAVKQQKNQGNGETCVER